MPCRSKLQKMGWLLLISGTLSTVEASVHRYVSFGMPDALLKEQLQAAGRAHDETIVFRGLPEPGGYPRFIRQLAPLLKALPKARRPAVVIDPKAFVTAGIDRVPVREVMGRFDVQDARYPVIEPDPRVRMQQRLKGLSTEAWHTALRPQTRPATLEAYPPATSESRVRLDATFTLPRALHTADGRIFAKQGQTADPLTLFPLPAPIIIMDAQRPESIAAVRQRLQTLKGPAQLLAAGLNPDQAPGVIARVSTELGAPIYLAPPGWLSQLRINTLPAEVQVIDSRIEVRQWPP